MGASEFGEMLRRGRLAAGLTQEGLASRAEMSVRAIGDLEWGRTTRPFRRSVRQLAAALGLEGTPADEFASHALARPTIGGGDAAWPPAAERGLPGLAPPGRRRGTGAGGDGQRGDAAG